jgi:hypothetical protein
LHDAISSLAATIAAGADPTLLAPCSEPSGSAACLDAFERSFTERAFGRPANASELAQLAAITATAEDYATSVRLVIEYVLQSPPMLYVSELGAEDAPPTPGQPIALTPYEVASQLSFLLTGERPDAALLERARTGALATADGVRAETERLLASESAIVELARFVGGWLDMAPIADAPKSAEAFPELTPEIVGAMQAEYDTFVSSQLRDGGGSLQAFLTVQSTEIPSALGIIYGADLLGGASLDPTRRRGVLALPGFLAYHAADHHSGPVERGLFVRRQLLCHTVSSPPADVLTEITQNPVQPGDATATTRQKFEVHLNEDSCAGCHIQFDPIGFGLEEMDGIGRYRTTEHGLPVDSTGELLDTDVDGPFQGVVELSQKLAQSQMLGDCFVHHYFRFALSRPAGDGDGCALERWQATFAQSGGRLRDLVLTSVEDAAFLTRRDDR